MASRRNTRRKEAQLAFEAISIEGGLLSPEWLSKVAQLAAGSQSEADYRIPKGLNLRDEIGRYWRIAQAHWKDFASGLTSKADRKCLAENFVLSILRETFDFKSLQPIEPCVISERKYPVGYSAFGNRVPVVIAPAGSGLDTLSPTFGDEGRRRSAFGLAQEYLNAADGSMWGIVTDGLILRIVRDNASLTRPAWIEADLARIFTEERYADFTALWLLLDESRFGREGQPVSECALETWRNAGREEGTRAREHLRKGVEEALIALGQGFLAHPENQPLRAALQNGSLTTRDYFAQLLRLVYRLIFLLTVEERNLLHTIDTSENTRKLYAQGYSMRRLAERSAKRNAHDRFSDLWQSLKIVLSRLATGEPRLGLPALAGIFATTQCPALDSAELENRALLLAIFKLAWLREEGLLARVNWRDMGPEELGSVYESLLELVPQISNGGRQFAFAVGDQTKGNARKTSGSYYTPDSLVQVLLDSALEPVIADTIARNPDKAVEALLSLSIVDPACGSGHFLLAAARRLAAHVARLQANGTPSAAEYRHALRQVVGKCIYGVDLNPMAVELCKVSLWMEAVEPGLPLTFLNSHIQHGNALLGTTPELMEKGIPDAAWERIEGDDREVAIALKKRNKQGASGQRSLETLWSQPSAIEAQTVRKAVTELEAAPDADATALARKESRWEDILASNEYRHQKFVADAWCAAFVWPKQAGSLAEAAPVNELWRQIRDGRGRPPALTKKTVEDLSRQYNFFHWHLQFPHVFSRSGFDVVLGNPPWEKINLKDEEFFAKTHPQIASAANKAQRKMLLEQLKIAEPQAFDLYKREKDMHDRVSGFFRFTGMYPLTGVSRINLYSVFCETAVRVLSLKGRAGLVLASGIVTDDNNKALFSSLVDKQQLVHAWDFENRQGIFRDVHTAFKFCLLCAAGKGFQQPLADFAFYLSKIDQLSQPDRHFTLTAVELATLNPTSKTCPTFRNKREAGITLGIYQRIPALELHEKSQGWAGTPKTPFNMSNDSSLFIQKVGVSSTELDNDLLPLYESKFIFQFNHRFATFAATGDDGATEVLPQQLVNPEFSITSRYWLPRKLLAERFPGRWFFGYRMITNATNERAAVAAIIPERPSAHSLSVADGLSASNALVLVSCVNSFVYDYTARQKIAGTNFSHWIWSQLPMPTLQQLSDPLRSPCVGSSFKEWLSPRALELTYTAWDLEPFARDVGFTGPPFHWNPERRFLLRCELDAAFFLLYGISREDTDYIMNTFPIVRKNDEKAHSEYRTKRVILEIYDEMAEAIRAGESYQTRLDPPPASIRVAHPPRFNQERIKVDVGNYILSFVFAFVRYHRGECDVMTLAHAYALMLQRNTLASLAETEFGKTAREWVEKSNQALDGRWFLPILRKMDEREIVTLDIRGDDVFVQQKDPQGPPSNSSVETDVFLVMRVLDLVPAAELTTTTKTIVPKAPRLALQEAEVPA